MRRLAALVALVGCARAQPPIAPVVTDEQGTNAVRITRTCITIDADHRGMAITAALGSGTVIGPGRVLTANHVTRCEGSALTVYRVDDTEGVARDAILLWRDPGHDLAELLSPGFVSHGQVRFGRASDGARVCYQPGAPSRERVCGTAKHERNTEPNGALDLKLTASVRHGNSGAALYDDSGRIVGVVTNTVSCDGCGGWGVSIDGRLP